MRKLYLALPAILTLTLAACGTSGDEPTMSEATSTVEETATETTTEAAQATDEEVDAWAKSVIGLSPEQPWSDGAASASWAYAVENARIGDSGDVVIRAALDRDTDKSLAEQIAGLYANSLASYPPEWANLVSYVIVENSAGDIITQERI